MRRRVAILSSFLFLVVVSGSASPGAQAATHPACSMLTVWAHAPNIPFEYNFCISVVPSSPGASTISAIRIFSKGVKNEIVPLEKLNQGFSPTDPGSATPLIAFKGENVAPETGGRVTITYLRPDKTTAPVTTNLERRNGVWITTQDTLQVNLADILMSTKSAGISIESVALTADHAIPGTTF